MTDRVHLGSLNIASVLFKFINDKVLPEVGVSKDRFWAGLDAAVHDLGPKNRELLQVRADIQGKIDAWHRQHRDQPFDMAAYKAHLTAIG